MRKFFRFFFQKHRPILKIQPSIVNLTQLSSAGDVPNLFEADEYEKVIIGCRPPAKQAGIDEGNRDMIYDFFISRVRKNLHLVICMSPVGDAFR